MRFQESFLHKKKTGSVKRIRPYLLMKTNTLIRVYGRYETDESSVVCLDELFRC